jgi:hypothetical protein
MVKTIKIDDIEYVRKDDVQKEAQTLDGLKYVIVRTYSAGVFAGYIESQVGQEVVLRQARRLWYWDGAASLSQLAMDGVAKPQNCKFPKEVTKIKLLNVIEIIDATEKAQKSIFEVSEWKQ